MMYDYLKFYNIPVTIVCTKVDKVSKNNHNKNKTNNNERIKYSR